jgi:hypothetical protein
VDWPNQSRSSAPAPANATPLMNSRRLMSECPHCAPSPRICQAQHGGGLDVRAGINRQHIKVHACGSSLAINR